MPDIRDDIKLSVRLCGKSIASVSRATGIEYRRLSGFVNGYWYISPEEEANIRRVIEQWKNELRERIAA